MLGIPDNEPTETAKLMERDQFIATHMPALAKDEIRHNVLLAILKRARLDPSVGLRTWCLGGPGACAVQQSGYGIVLGAVDEMQAQQLALTVKNEDFRSIFGPDDTAQWFVEAAAEHGIQFPKLICQSILVLGERPQSPSIVGEARLAHASDLDLIYSWALAFGAEAVPEQPAPTREDILARISAGRIWLWTVDGVGVAMSAIGRSLDRGVAISLVYTPPEFRRRGFAGAVTTTVATRVFDRAAEFVYLFVDDSNPASNRCYEKIGFRYYCRSNMYHRG